MEKKKAEAIKVGDKLTIEDEVCIVTKVEVSKIGKHGKHKVRIEAESSKKEKKILVRPSDFEVEVL